MQKKSDRKLAVSTQNKGFGDLPSSRMASPRNFARNMVLCAFRALTGTIFVPILLPNMSGDFLAVRFFAPDPQDILGDPP